jgi:anti-sigma regulatory factor (Ser/Thr protein kinase)
MKTMAPIRQAVLRERRLTLPAGPPAAAAARTQVRAAIGAWEVPVNSSVAALLTSELVTNAIQHETGETIMLVITCAWGQLSVDVHDTSHELPVPLDGPVDAEAGRGLLLVASLSTAWGYYRTAAGKAVYFTLAYQDDRAAAGPSPVGNRTWVR